MGTIKAGSGGNVADVNKFLQLLVKSTTESEFEFAAEKGEAYTWTAATFDPAAAATILLVKNTGSEEMHMESLTITSDVDTVAQIHLPTTEVTVSGTTVVGVNQNTGSSNVAEADAAANESGNTQGSIIWAHEIYAADGPIVISLVGVILAKNKSIGVDFVANVAACGATFKAHFEVD